jgi:DNA-binding response OmpR family regulator
MPMPETRHPPQILIVDDEESLRFFIAEGLSRQGWQVVEVDSGEAALAALEEQSFDLILLDLRMVGIDGLTVMRQVKGRWPETMIIIMTAYASIDSAIEAVRQGAFDYLQKPCSIDDIVACARQALEKKAELDQQRWLLEQNDAVPAVGDRSTTPGAVKSGALTIELGSRTVSLAGQPVSLTPTEYELLALLAGSPGRPVPLERLIREGLTYDPDDYQAQETLRVHISRLRRKLDPKFIRTVRGGGYALANIPPLS